MLTIRFSRIGKKNKPMYRIIISEKSKDPYGRALEILGSYNPHTKELKAKAERIKHWLSKGSGISPSVNNLLIDKNIIEGEKAKASKAKKKKSSSATSSVKTTEAKKATEDKKAKNDSLIDTAREKKAEEKSKETSKEGKKDDEAKDKIKNETKKEEKKTDDKQQTAEEKE